MQDIGGLDIQKQEIREAVELPLTHHELYRQIGIDPPRGVLLYGVFAAANAVKVLGPDISNSLNPTRIAAVRLEQ